MKDAFKHLSWFFKKEYRKYIFIAIVLLALAITPVLPARFLGQAIDEIASGVLTSNSLLYFVLALMLVPIVRYILNKIYHYQINYLGHKLSYQLRENYIAHLFELDATNFDQYTKGDLITRATSDLQNLTMLATNFLQTVVFNSGVVVSAIVMMVIISPLLTLASILIMPIAIFWLNKRRLKKRSYYKTHREIYSEMTEVVLESIEGVKAIRAYGEEDNNFKKAKQAINNDINSWWYIIKFESIYGPLFELVYTICYFIGISLGSYFVIYSRISAGNLVTFLMYIGMLYGPLIALSNVLNNVNNITISDQRYFEIMNTIPTVKDHLNSIPVIDFKQIIYKNVTLKYPNHETAAIHDINLCIRKGETIGIVGPTGSGKSSLIRPLLRQYNTTEGKILIDDVNLENILVDDVHDLIGYVPQDHVLFRRSVDDNILIGNPKASIKNINEAVALADFEKDIKALPFGLDTMVAELGSSLSGGQKQRLSIARALVKNPEILILDDSLSAVDALTEQNIIKNLQEARSDKTNIIIAHRFSAVSSADKIMVMQNGVITDIGTHQELLRYDNWYKMQYLKQIKGEVHA